jgi:opacity protein-like surface antigen
VYSVDSANLSDYRTGGVVSSWLKSFNDGTGVAKSMQFSVGTEYAYNDQFFVRAGYFYENRNRGNRKYATVGAGFKLDFMDINLSYLVPSGAGITRNPLSNTMRLGVCFKLGE